MHVVYKLGLGETSQENIARVRADKFQTVALSKGLGEGNTTSKISRVEKGGYIVTVYKLGFKKRSEIRTLLFSGKCGWKQN